VAVDANDALKTRINSGPLAGVIQYAEAWMSTAYDPLTFPGETTGVCSPQPWLPAGLPLSPREYARHIQTWAWSGRVPSDSRPSAREQTSRSGSQSNPPAADIRQRRT